MSVLVMPMWGIHGFWLSQLRTLIASLWDIMNKKEKHGSAEFHVE